MTSSESAPASATARYFIPAQSHFFSPSDSTARNTAHKQHDTTREKNKKEKNMDPLSVAASVAGLAAAAAKITKSLQALTSADRLARSVAAETEALVAVFSQLNGYLRASNNIDNKQRMSLTTVDQFVTVMTHAVLTFAELEEELDGLEIGRDPQGWDRVKWAGKQEALKEILADLQQQKLSLNLMIGIWTWYVSRI
jgi:hypothetical protein